GRARRAVGEAAAHERLGLRAVDVDDRALGSDLRQPTAVAAVAAEAGVVVELWPELRDLPVEVERADAGLEHVLLVRGQVRSGMGDREPRSIVDGGRAAEAILARGVIAARRKRGHRERPSHASRISGLTPEFAWDDPMAPSRPREV